MKEKISVKYRNGDKERLQVQMELQNNNKKNCVEKRVRFYSSRISFGPIL